MIIITSTVQIKPEWWDEAQQVSQSHVEKSRLESGCISHNWFVHPTEEFTLFFYEEWLDQASIATHFQMDYSQELASNLVRWASEPVKLRMMPVTDTIERSVE